MKKLLISLALGMAYCLSSQAVAGPDAALAKTTAAKPAPAAKFSAMYVFGGPLEDNGNFASVFGDLPAPFYKNHFTNGPDAVEYLAENLGFTLSPSLHRVGPVVGNNFASADALANGTEPKDLQGQLDAYLGSTGGKADGNALYYVIIGGNDIIAATLETDDAKTRSIVDGAIAAKKRALLRMAHAGARTVFFDNFTNLGLTPKIRKAGLSARGEWVSRYHNQNLERMFNEVQAEVGPKLNLIRFDFWQFSANELINAAAPLGFTNTTDACSESADCDLDKYVFINDLFLTARVHKLWGQALTAKLNRGLYCKDHPRNVYCVADKLIEHTPYTGD